MRALIIGSSIAGALGLVLGAHFQFARHEPPPDLDDAAQAVAQWAAPPADAAEPAEGDSPVLYVRWDERWVSEADRAAATAREETLADASPAPGLDAAGLPAQPSAGQGPDAQAGGLAPAPIAAGAPAAATP